jgi:hypothetical protein
MPALKQMSIKEYVAYRKAAGNIITTIAVAKAIRMGHRTPGIMSYDKYGGTYLLYVSLQELDSFLVLIKKPTKLRA